MMTEKTIPDAIVDIINNCSNLDSWRIKQFRDVIVFTGIYDGDTQIKIIKTPIVDKKAMTKEEIIEKVISLKKQGYSQEQIGLIFDISQKTVSSYLK